MLDAKYGPGVKTCKALNESDAQAGWLKLYLVLQNSYFKDNDFSANPIKTFLKPYYYNAKYN